MAWNPEQLHMQKKERISKKGTAAGSVKQFLLNRLGLQKEYLSGTTTELGSVRQTNTTLRRSPLRQPWQPQPSKLRRSKPSRRNPVAALRSARKTSDENVHLPVWHVTAAAMTSTGPRTCTRQRSERRRSPHSLPRLA